MMIEVIGKNNFVPTEAIKKYAEDKLQKVIRLFGEDTISKIRVVTKVYPDHHKVEVTVFAGKQNIRAEVQEPDMYAAIDLSIDKLVAQVKKNRDKLRSHLEKTGIKDVFSTEFDALALEKELQASTLVKNKKIELVPMTKEEAIMQMELSDHDFFVYLDLKTERTNVLYKRHDGDYAVIETEEKLD